MAVDQTVPQARATSAREAGTPWRLLSLLICMTAIGPTTLNILVPALPNLAVLLGTDAKTVQLAVSLYLIGLASAQLVAGPLSDRLPSVLTESARIVSESDKRNPLQLTLPLLDERVYGDTRIAIHSGR